MGEPKPITAQLHEIAVPEDFLQCRNCGTTEWGIAKKVDHIQARAMKVAKPVLQIKCRLCERRYIVDVPPTEDGDE